MAGEEKMRHDGEGRQTRLSEIEEPIEVDARWLMLSKEQTKQLQMLKQQIETSQHKDKVIVGPRI